MIQFYGRLPLLPHSPPPTYIRPDGDKPALSFLSRSCCCSPVPAQSLERSRNGLERTDAELSPPRRTKFISLQIRSVSIARFVQNPLVPLPLRNKSSSPSRARSDLTFNPRPPSLAFAFASLSRLRRLYGFRPPKFLLAASAPPDPERIQAALAQGSKLFLPLSCLWRPLFCSGPSHRFGDHICSL